VVDEAGASVYSATELAAKELPSLDVTHRGAVSIARRLMDPMSELVKVGPQSLGVGLYQHDVDQKRLEEELTGVTQCCVTAVGCDANRASPELLRYVAGLTPKLAEAVIAQRQDSGGFKTREELRQVRGLGPKTFTQCAGFLRIYSGKEPLDATSIHPESYGVAKKLQQQFGPRLDQLKEVLDEQELGVGRATLQDIVAQLRGAADDERAARPAPTLKSVSGKHTTSTGAIDAALAGVTVDGLKQGMLVVGTVRNVVPFGAFVDLGVQSDGLLHRSQYPRSAPRDGSWPVINEVIEVKIVSVSRDQRKTKISVSML